MSTCVTDTCAFWGRKKLKEPSYTFNEINGILTVEFVPERCGGPTIVAWQDWFESVFIESTHGNRIAALFLQHNDAKFTLLWSHANGTDLGREAGDYIKTSDKLQCNVLAYDFSGYGLSSGSPSEENLYGDARAAANFLTQTLGISYEKIVVFGHSIGTVAAIDLAANMHPAGAIIVGSFVSAYCAKLPCLPSSLPGDKLKNIDKVRHIRCPTLFIHGTEDKTFGVGQAADLRKECPGAAEIAPLWLEGAGHMDVIRKDEYFDRMEKFVKTEIGLTPW